MLVVAFADKASAMDGDTHGLRVARGHEIEKRKGHVLLVCGLRLTLQPERNLGIAGHGKRAANHGDSLDPWEGLELPHGLAIVGAQLGGGRVLAGSQGDVVSEHVAGVKSWIDGPEASQAPNHEPR